jgi:hypothetical protein
MLHDFSVDVSVNNANKVFDQPSIANSSKEKSEWFKLKLIDVLVPCDIQGIKYGWLSYSPFGIISQDIV